MFNKNINRPSLRQPKIYVPAPEEIKKPLPKYVKILILVFVVLVALIYLVFFLPVFKIKNLDIMGNPSEKTLIYLQSFIGSNVFRLHPSAISDQLQIINPEYDNISVSIGIPNTLRVKFQERSPSLVWNSGANFYLVDDNQIAYKQVEAKPDNIILVIDQKAVGIKLPEQIASSNFVEFLKNVKAKVTDSGLEVDHFEINETTFQVEAVTKQDLPAGRQGIKIIFDTTRSVSDQIDALSNVYKDHKDAIKQYIDVRVEGKVYFQ